MLKLTAVLGLISCTLPCAAQTMAVCNKPPTPAMLASARTANRILEKVVPKDALDLDRLRKTAQKDAAQHPSDPFALAVLGNIQFRAGDLESSIATLNRSMQIFPCIAYVHFTAAKYYALTGDTAAAQQQIELAHALNPGVPEIAAEWTHTHAPSESAGRRAYPTQLQRRAPLSAAPTGAKPFSGLPDRPLLAPVAREVDLALEKSGPPDVGDNFATLDVTINGKPVRLLLNLGSEEFTLTRSAAQRIGIDAGRNAHADLTIGDLLISAVPLTVTNTPENGRRAALFTDGSIGLYFFSRSLIKLDVWGGHLTLSPLPPQPPPASGHDARWTPLYIVPSTHQLLISAVIGPKMPQLFLLDLTADSSSIAPDTSGRADDVQHFVGGAGQWSTNTIRIYISGKTVEVPTPRVLAEPRFPNLGMGVSGRLGRNAIRGVNLTFDYRDHLLKVN